MLYYTLQFNKPPVAKRYGGVKALKEKAHFVKTTIGPRAPEPGIEEIRKESRFQQLSETRSSVKAHTEDFLLRFGRRVVPWFDRLTINCRSAPFASDYYPVQEGRFSLGLHL